MNKNVYLYYPWSFPDASYYKYLVESPPQNINYYNVDKKYLGIIASKNKFAFSNKLKNVLRTSALIFGHSIPNIKYCNPSDADIIHAAHGLVYTKKPWVVDIEDSWNLSLTGQYNFINKYFVNKLILRDNCKYILPWTNYAKNKFLSLFPKARDKTEVLYPAVPYFYDKFNLKKNSDKINLLFISRYFYMKGGLYVLETYKQLKLKYTNLSLTIVSDIPDVVWKRYKNIKDINYIGLISQDKLFKEIYPSGDILIYPSFIDTFGYALLEAMSFGIPVVTIDNPTRKEIIDDGITGFVVDVNKNIDYFHLDRNIINGLVNKVELLLNSKKLLRQMQNNCKGQIINGKFSINNRNKKLMEIYDDILM